MMLDRKQMAARLRVTLDTFRKRIVVRPDFPKPVLRHSRNKVRWEEAAFERWLKRQAELAKS